MKSVFNTDDNAELITRIDKLTPTTPSLWGKMDVAQMLAHCHMPVKIGLGEFQMKRNWLGLLFGPMAKKKMITPEPFKHNLPTFKEIKITDAKQFDAEKESLKALIGRLKNSADVLAKNPHPFYGDLTVEEWDILQYKHIDHHLRQFGV